MFKKEVAQDQFNSLLRFVIANGDYPNCDRCNVVDVVLDSTKLSLTICFNEKKNQVCICEVSNPVSEEMSDELKEKCFNELLRLASGDWVMNEQGEKMYIFYREKIEPETECCELNR